MELETLVTENRTDNYELIPKEYKDLFRKNYYELSNLDKDNQKILINIVKNGLGTLSDVKEYSANDIKTFTKVADNLKRNEMLNYSFYETVRLIQYHTTGMSKFKDEDGNLLPRTRISFNHLQHHRFNFYNDLYKEHRDELSVVQKRKLEKILISENIAIIEENLEGLKHNSSHAMFFLHLAIDDFKRMDRKICKNIYPKVAKIIQKRYEKNESYFEKIGLESAIGTLCKIKYETKEKFDGKKTNVEVWNHCYKQVRNYLKRNTYHDLSKVYKYDIRLMQAVLFGLIQSEFYLSTTNNETENSQDYENFKIRKRNIKKYNKEYRRIIRDYDKDVFDDYSAAINRIDNILERLKTYEVGLKNNDYKDKRIDNSKYKARKKKRTGKGKWQPDYAARTNIKLKN